MIRETIHLYSPDEYNHFRGDFIPNLNAYLHEEGENLPAIIVAPGGGYEFVSAGEAYIVAMKYYKAGFQAYILTYTTNPYGAFKPIGLQPLKDVSRAVCEVRKRKACDRINANSVAIIGFSAGGHLAASLAVHYAYDGIKAACDNEISNRPDAVILSYPVISAYEYSHKGSVTALYGNNPTPQQLQFFATEKNVTADTPPAFLWHTLSDNVVPVENSLLYMAACRNNNIPAEIHIYPTGQHGLSLATQEWKENVIGDSAYTYYQHFQDTIYLIENNPRLVPNRLKGAKNMNIEQYAHAFYQMGKENNKSSGFIYPTFDDRVGEWAETSIGFLHKSFSGLYK